jgi:hypothetical protein
VEENESGQGAPGARAGDDRRRRPAEPRVLHPPATSFVVADLRDTDVDRPLGQRRVEVLSAIAAVPSPGEHPDAVADAITRGSEDTVAGGSLCAALQADTVHAC